MNIGAKPLQKSKTDTCFAPERVCYEAHWQDQSVFISAPCQSTREWQWHCLASAILLERLEDACVLAETLLESSLQFFVSELPNDEPVRQNIENDYLRVVLSRPTDEVEIWIPACAHKNVLQHSKLIEEASLQWAEVRASVQIAQILLGEKDIARLAHGSLMLIPASWQTHWACIVEIPQFGSSVKSRIDPKAGVILLSDSAKPLDAVNAQHAKSGLVHVYLDQSVLIDPSYLLSAKTKNEKNAQSKASLPLSMDQARCHCLVGDKCFSAELTQVGDGYGLCIKECL